MVYELAPQNNLELDGTYHLQQPIAQTVTDNTLRLSPQQWAEQLRALIRTAYPAQSSAETYSIAASRALQAIMDYTGWSVRAIAEGLLGVSHTTANQILRRLREPQFELFRRIRTVHDVVERVWMIGGRASPEVDRLLTTLDESGDSAASALRRNEITKAMSLVYFARRPRTAEMLKIKPSPFAVGEERFAYLDEN